MNEQTIRRWYDIYKNNNQLVEIRIIDNNQKRIYSGYFTDIETLIKSIRPYNSSNIYFTLNSIEPACYSREQHDRIVTKVKSTTSDKEIIGLDWCLIDIDCEKPSDTNSTDAEKELAKNIVNNVYKFLRDEGFYQPVICDSANGYHLTYKMAMKNTPENIETLKNFLQVLGMLFSTDKVKVDTTTYNASRVCKLYGCVSRKGSNTKDRPQRESSIIRVPDEVKVTPKEYFEKVASMLPKSEGANRHNNYSTESFDLEAFIAKHDIKINKIQETPNYTKYVLEECCFNSAHRAPDSALFKMKDGSVGFRCLHASDSAYTWRDFRLHYEPNAYDTETSYNKYINPRKNSPYTPNELKKIREQVVDERKGNVWQTMEEIEDEDRSKIVSIPSGIIQYDKECCGFDIPSLSVWSGSNGSAKSTLLNQVALNAINKGFRVAMYSGELKNKKLKRWFLYQAAGKSYNIKSQYNDYDYYTPIAVKNKIVKWMSGKFYNYNTKYSHNIEQICKELEALVAEHKVDMIVVDNLSCLDLDELNGAINEQQKTAVKMLLRLADKLDVAMHIVVHPKKSQSYLRKDDISGSKTITDLADNVFIVHRWNLDTQKASQEFLPPSVYSDLCNSQVSNIVEVVKHREFGDAEGHIYKLYFETESKRLKNSPAEHVVYGWQEEPLQQSFISDEDEEVDYFTQLNDSDVPF